MATNGGGGSSLKKLPEKSMGPTKTNLIGKRILYPILFQTTDDSFPKKDSGGCGKTRASVPKSAFEINMKANAKIMKTITNLVLEMHIRS
ncbi:MAG: hypothetical protein WCW78_03700 [Candidatus Paceibacterota bacterium]|jgi:hypothetical protein